MYTVSTGCSTDEPKVGAMSAMTKVLQRLLTNNKQIAATCHIMAEELHCLIANKLNIMQVAVDAILL